jgi:anti-sigma-K factor RskA
VSEKIPASFIPYQKKITPYLDGTLSPSDRSEFEAFVATHPEFESLIKSRREEINLIKDLIPASSLNPEALKLLEGEIKDSVFNLLKEEPKSLWQSVELKIEDWLNR